MSMYTADQIKEKAISKSIGPTEYKKSGKGYFINLDEYTEDGYQRVVEVTKRFWNTIEAPICG